ncbi:TIGR03086 family metal-binding protein [Streptomyces sp. ISL-11]|uniref:TIGR03086 family metal-binding protein n=1 Tax=Streptomyces sp. ISL-11 TaxID=2819174 RepID=UPI001BED1C12|nr:TIGR03086 family metal-binding protein [Streptomyces sp. ISL-11]MBT2387763.1 TIGR03086 family protein [Streptomyces sp. ISL-11]
MSSDALLSRHREALALFGDRVHTVRPDQWDDPTPCTEWSVRDLVNHLTVEQLWVPPLLDGAAIEDLGDSLEGDLLGDDPVAAWDDAAAAARKAFGAPGALKREVALSQGPTRADAYGAQMTADAAVHAWDLSRAIGADEHLPEALVEFTREEVEPYADALAGTGLFAKPVRVPADADAQTRLLGQLGRRA